MNNKAVVFRVIPGSIADEAEIRPGDTILSINGEKIVDIFDYRFLITSQKLVIRVLKKDKELWEVEVEKDEYEDLGIEFENPLISEEKSCKNKCIFCFIDQLPHGMRDTLYFKDDDIRLSFLTGNYVTLTNTDREEIERLIRYKMGSINISVHTTEPELRKFMLNNRFAGDILKKIKTLVNGGITVNCQVVLCRDINDGKNLDKTISDLAELYPGMRSLSIVPVGITEHRQGLYALKPYDRQSSLDVIKKVEYCQKLLYKEHGSRVVFIADEFYIMAGLKVPYYKHYEDFPQIENGVGLISLMWHEFYSYLQSDDLKMKKQCPREVSIATGLSAAGHINDMVTSLKKRYNKLRVNVYQIKNYFFGENVTVAGLITGKDLLSQLRGKPLGEELLISRSMLKDGEEIFLDDIAVDMLEEELKVKVTAVENSGRDFIKKVLGIDNVY